MRATTESSTFAMAKSRYSIPHNSPVWWYNNFLSSYFQTDVEDNPVDVWDLLRDMRAKFTLAKTLLSIDEPLNAIAGEQSITGKKNNSKPKTLNW